MRIRLVAADVVPVVIVPSGCSFGGVLHMKVIYFISILRTYDNLSLFGYIYNEIQNKYHICASRNELLILRKLKGIIPVYREIAHEK